MNKKMLSRLISFVCLLFVLIIPLSSCSTKTTKNEDKKVNSAQIKRVELKQIEDSLLRAAGIDDSFIFEPTVPDKSIKSIKYWIDHYEKGKLKGKISETEQLVPNRVIWSMRTPERNGQSQEWILSTYGESFTGVGNKVLVPNLRVGWTGPNDKQTLAKGKTTNLAYITMGTVSAELWSDPLDEKSTGFKKLINNNEHVYILRCKAK